MKFLNHLKLLRGSKRKSKKLTEEEIQKVHKIVLSDLRAYNAEKRRANFKIITSSK